MSEYRFKRVLLKLSGEALMGDAGYGIDPAVLDSLATQLKTVCAGGIEIAIVKCDKSQICREVIDLELAPEFARKPEPLNRIFFGKIVIAFYARDLGQSY